jgi:hypothetical protein
MLFFSGYLSLDHYPMQRRTIPPPPPTPPPFHLSIDLATRPHAYRDIRNFYPVMYTHNLDDQDEERRRRHAFSHALRTPLSCCLTYGRILRRWPTTTATKTTTTDKDNDAEMEQSKRRQFPAAGSSKKRQIKRQTNYCCCCCCYDHSTTIGRTISPTYICSLFV